ncbi:MAG: helix-turn-helix transcriptional regulator [Bdellovibrionaceae bacterium]|nr:helix-turn-helix transcriptional regulator [Pseudobdellovibrionaceae bacterium]MDW8191159.1 helix-turn-helix transcriptional regulator [Pseudobdellovibrionaceae bacterium]
MLRDILIQKGLSNREAEVAELVTRGLSNKEVANQLFVTEKTVKFHLTNIYKKMNVKSRAQLIVWCLPHLSFIENERPQAQANPMATPINSSATSAMNTAASANTSHAQQATVTPLIIPGRSNVLISGQGNGDIGTGAL